ncbi:alkyl/aryl-sulfatase [Echinimonas agarilytica]|uniref:MBL fold metallo-hydrolase n=1 Tax=Echinimonas agarilytica TaxID=1215918 RepID=A0AA42B755_9GAMM|nr:alkyl sulfatase dimerization domain-containing protein [Echinimonas agarilytica]MCM2678863.1 MBL fold metallo-hydrolase [Echinimonas agarilytica]
MKHSIIAFSVATIVGVHLVPQSAVAHGDGEMEFAPIVLNYDGKPASEHTINANKQVAETLNWDDRTAFELDAKGLIATLDENTSAIIRDSFEFIGSDIPDSVNPSLYRQAQLNQQANGLYKVREGIYQVRGTDLSSMTFIRSQSGWIVYDVLLTKEAAAQSLEFALTNLPEGGDLPVVAMIYSHSHADHFGGSRAIQERFPDVKVYGPNNVTAEVVDENVLAGNAMSRRAAYQYGSTLQRHDHGIVDAALAKGLSSGEITYVKPHYTLNSTQKFETLTIDGLEMIFMDASGTEAASEMVTYIPSMKALWTGELTYHGMHNIYTLRGAKVRDSLKWSREINRMVTTWGDDVEVLFASHSAPVWGQNEVNEFLKLQRDNYGLVHNQSLRLANQGVVLQDIGDAILETIPKSVYDVWHTNGYHGTYSHNARAVYNMYLGYFDMNPANLNPLPTQQEATKFVEYMGGADQATAKASQDFSQGEYRFVATALNKVLLANPEHEGARQLLADTYEQLGYQAEGAGWRNIYLSGAQELRSGIQPGTPKTASPDVLSEMDLSTLFDFLAVQVDSIQAANLGTVSLSIHEQDTNTHLYVELSHGNLNNIYVNQAQKADAQISLKQSDVTRIVLQQTDFDSLVEQGKASISGDTQALNKILGTLVEFDPAFEIVPLPSKPHQH